MADIERPAVTAARLAVGLTKLDSDFVDHGDGNDTVPGTDIKRLKPVPLGAKAKGFVSDETSALIEALIRRRDSTPPQPRAEPKHLRTGRNAYWQRERAKKRRGKRLTEQEQHGGEPASATSG
jgi:hypothetical protein